MDGYRWRERERGERGERGEIEERYFKDRWMKIEER